MRSYDQYCPAALALDLVGDRWTLLIVRELGIAAARYGDLHRALPGIATNLLADRLRTLVAADVIYNDGTSYHLTAWGEELFEIVARIGRWGSRLLLDGAGDRRFRARYLLPLIHAVYEMDGGADLNGLAPLSIRIDDPDDVSVRVDVSSTHVDARLDDHQEPADVVLTGDPRTVIATLVGAIAPTDAAIGSRQARQRLRAFTARSPYAR